MEQKDSFQQILQKKMTQENSLNSVATEVFKPFNLPNTPPHPLWLRLENFTPLKFTPGRPYPACPPQKKATLPPKIANKPLPQEPSWPLDTLPKQTQEDIQLLLRSQESLGKTQANKGGQKLTFSQTEIKKIYRRLALSLHPDSAGPRASSEAFCLCTEAYHRVIRDLAELRTTSSASNRPEF